MAERASWSHRQYVYRCARVEGRRLSRDEWKFILSGRWPGF